MNVLYEEDGDFKVGAILADNTTSFQVEAPHGKRSKIKSNAVILRFEQPPLGEFLAQAEKIADELDIDFLWQCSGEEEFGFDTLTQEYFGRPPQPMELAGVLLRLHSAPMHFYKKGRGRYKPAPEEALKSALASVERKQRQAAQQAAYAEQLKSGVLPAAFQPLLNQLLYQPDRNTLEFKALSEACEALKLTIPKLLESCGAIPSSHDFHFNRFLLENFPHGMAFDNVEEIAAPSDLPLADTAAFSIDDATTTEIDDAFSLKRLINGNWRIGIHIAAPALGFAVDSPLDLVAQQRLSTVYMPGRKITMLPETVVEKFSLIEGRVCPALSMYIEVSENDYIIGDCASRIENIQVAANLRHDFIEQHFNEEKLSGGNSSDYPYKKELEVLWGFAKKLEATRGKAEQHRIDYNFYVADDRVTISERKRGSPIDKLVSELMIFVNTAWGKLLADHDVAGIYRTQNNGKVKMSSVAAPHQGLGVEQYIWASSPLRRYVDLLNQRQLLAVVRKEDAPPYAQRSEALTTIMRNFELTYDAYNQFQDGMERYWCLRWLLQENISEIGAMVIKENLVRLDGLPLVMRIPDLPETAPGKTVILEVGKIDLLELGLVCRYKHAVEAEAESVPSV